MTRPFLLVALLVALVGCATPTAVTPPSAGAETVQVGTEGVIPAAVTVEIPAIGAASSLVELGLNPDGTLAVPPITDPGQASIYLTPTGGVSPGQPGPAIVAGHRSGQVDGVSVPGVFARLPDLVAGDEIRTSDTAGVTLRWRVQKVTTYPKDAVDWDAIAADTAGPELRLITCGGALGTTPEGARSYTDNVVAWAVPA